MDDTKWERYAGIAGFLFVILVLVVSFIPGAPPKPDDVGDIAKYFKDHDGAIQAAAFLNGFAGLAFLVFVTAVSGMIRRAEGAPRLSVVAFGGGAVALVFAFANAAILSAAAITDSGSQGTYVLSLTFTGVGTFGLIALAGATAVAAFQTRMLPNWVAWISAATAVVAIPGASIASTSRDAAFFLSFIGFLVFVVWVLSVSFVLFRPQAAAAK
ncbi:MAG TPA: hypothetical protein VEO00_04400 [Actinomycetota bacterium]|nr:hypothetical protein [Actinomycetota bacterium]